MHYYAINETTKELLPVPNLRNQLPKESYSYGSVLIDTGLSELTEGHNGYLIWRSNRFYLADDDNGRLCSSQLPTLRNAGGRPLESWTNPVTDKVCTNINTVYKAIAERYGLSKAYVTMMTSVAQKIRDQLEAAMQVGMFFANNCKPEKREAEYARAVLKVCQGLRRAAIVAECEVFRGDTFAVQVNTNSYRSGWVPIDGDKVLDTLKQGEHVKWKENFLYWDHPEFETHYPNERNDIEYLSDYARDNTRYKPEVGYEYDMHGNKKKDEHGNNIRVYGSEFDRLLKVYERNQEAPEWN